MIRYPGSKDKIARAIIRRFPPRVSLPVFASEGEYREPFFGAGAIGLRVLASLHPSTRVWINDRDYGMACLWKSVSAQPSELISKIDRFIPSVDSFYRFREEDEAKDLDVVETGFRKLVLHQTSFSGLGAKAGGPIGGRQQRSAYNVRCRWSAPRLRRDILRAHALFRRFTKLEVTARDFADVLADAPSQAFIYADPPYVEKGPQLYKHAMSEEDHRRLAEMLRSTRASWVLSYDDHPLVRELYSWAEIATVELTYTTAVASKTRRKNSEVIIAPMPAQKAAA